MGKIPSSSWDRDFNPRDSRHWSFPRDSRGLGMNRAWLTNEDFSDDSPSRRENKSTGMLMTIAIIFGVILLALT